MQGLIKAPSGALSLLERLENAGFSAYIVGGCVRNALLGITPDDFDITTSARPEETEKVFSELRTVETGIKHGTVTVILDGEPYEITTFRADGEYSDGRHPESVSYSDNLETDLARRDFTVNAMAYSPKRGLIDIFGGRKDLENRVLRAVGDPSERFTEDALRILRALRFASVYGFKIEKETAASAKRLAKRISLLSGERVFSELKKLLMGDFCEQVLLEFPEIIYEALPELRPSVGFDQHSPHHVYDVYTHSVKAAAYSPKDASLRLSALLHDVGKPETFAIGKDGAGHFYGHSEASVRLAEQALLRLKADNCTLSTVRTLIKYHDTVLPTDEKSVKRWLNKLTPNGLLQLLELKRADNMAQVLEPERSEICQNRLAGYGEIRTAIEKINAEDACFSLKQLAVNGDDLAELGVPRSKEMGKALSLILEAVISGEVKNTRSDIVSYFLSKR